MVIEYHEKYLRRLANIFLDKYEMFGRKGAQEWHSRTTGRDEKLKELLNETVKLQAPLRGKVVKD